MNPINNNFFYSQYESFPYFGGGVNRGGNDHVPCQMVKQGFYHNNTVHRASPWFKTIWNPTSSPYSHYLERKGFHLPSRKEIGICYVNVHGIEAKINPNFPIALVTYYPVKSEQYFQTMEQAMLYIPSTETNKSSEWQILNLITGEILVEPTKALDL